MKIKPSIILLHGALGSFECFSTVATHLSDYAQVYSFNFSGHGGRDFEEHFSVDQFKNELMQFIRYSEIEKPQIFGYSMGGYVAVKAAVESGDLIGDIMTLATKWSWDKATAENEVKKLNPEKIESKVPAFAQLLKQRHALNSWKKLVKCTAELMVDLGSGQALKYEDLKHISNKITITVGSLDNMVTREESQHVASVLNNGHFKSFEGVEHPIEKVDPKMLSNEILQTLL